MQKGFVQFIVLGIVVLAVVVAGAFYVGRTILKQVQPQNSAITSQLTPSPTSQPVQVAPSPSLVTDETANWEKQPLMDWA